MNGQLFTQDFLTAGIAQTPVWKELADDKLNAYVQSLRGVFKPFNAGSRPNEATTEILDAFPIVREEDEKAHGRYLTKDLVLAYLNAVTAGDLETKVTV